MERLEANRIVLRKLELEDAEQIFETWTNDEDVSRYMRWSTHKSVEETKQWLLEEEKNCKTEGQYTWGIELKETKKLIGSIGAYYREETDRYEIGYGIAKEYWRKGLTTEAVECMMNYLINKVGIKKFKASHAKENPASGAVMQKVGFRYIKDGYAEKFDKSVGYDTKEYYLDIDEIILVKPSKEYEQQAIEYKQEHFANGETKIHACSRWDKTENYDEWLKKLEEQSSFETLKTDWTVHTNFLGVRKSDNKIVGMIDIRHELTSDFLRNYAGHIGYGVRPSERRKGYVTQMLSKALHFCREELKLEKVMISCDKYNEGSRKTILNAGGVLEREYLADNGENVQVYWVKT